MESRDVDPTPIDWITRPPGADDVDPLGSVNGRSPGSGTAELLDPAA